MKTIPFVVGLISSAIAIAEVAAEGEAVVIPEIEVAAYSTLGAHLDALADRIPGGGVAVRFEAEELRDRRLPRIQLRRVYLADLLSALGQLTGTTIEVGGKVISVEDREGRGAAIGRIDLQGGGIAELTPLSGEESMMQVYDLTDLLTQTDSSQAGASRIVRLMESKLREHARFRRDDLSKEPFTVEYNRATGIIVLKAPVAYHLTAENLLADLRQTAGIRSDEPVEVNEVSVESVSVTAVNGKQGEEEQEQEQVDAVLAGIETAALLRALREMNRKLDLLEKRTREQDAQIDELQRRLNSRDEPKASE